MSFEPVSYVATFSSGHEVLRAEAAAKRLGLRAELIPVPRGIASDCGFCLLLPYGGTDFVAARLALGGNIESAWLVRERTDDTRRVKEKRYERIA